MTKIKDAEKHRKLDLAKLAEAYLIIGRCPGGRPIVDGYMCHHCGADPSCNECDGVEGLVGHHGPN